MALTDNLQALLRQQAQEQISRLRQTMADSLPKFSQGRFGFTPNPNPLIANLRPEAERLNQRAAEVFESPSPAGGGQRPRFQLVPVAQAGVSATPFGPVRPSPRPTNVQQFIPEETHARLRQTAQQEAAAPKTASPARSEGLPQNRVGFLPQTPKEYRGLINQAAKEHGVPTKLLSALLMQESGYDPAVVSGKRRSSAGALGIAQFMPATAQRFGINPLDPEQAIPAAAKYLKMLYDMFGNWDLALAGYNAGEGNVQRYGGIPPFQETQNYVARIKQMAHGPSDMTGVDPEIIEAFRRAVYGN